MRARENRSFSLVIAIFSSLSLCKAPKHAHIICLEHPVATRCSSVNTEIFPDNRNDLDKAYESSLNKDHSRRIPS